MDASRSIIALRARWVFPVVGPPIDGGIVTIADGRIVSVGTPADVPPQDLGDVAILPGLINAHTHLEFSDLAAPLGEPGEALPGWIRKVVAYRRTANRSIDAAIRQGLTESHAAGVAALADIMTHAWTPQPGDVPALRFRETICLDPQGFDAAVDAQRNWLAQEANPAAAGISPHAPYTVPLPLVESLVALATEQQVPVAMHVAESPEELELLHAASGPFRTMLEDLGVWRDELHPAGRRPLDYLERLAAAPRSLVVHGNYLNTEEADFLAERADRMAVVYCPRTHARFGHTPYPLADYLARGVTVCLGTDSRASNPDLSIWKELQHVRASHPQASGDQILRTATSNSARMLGLADQGKLIAGALARLTLIQLGDPSAADPYNALFSESSTSRGV